MSEKNQSNLITYIMGGSSDIIIGLHGIKTLKESTEDKITCVLITHSKAAIDLVKENPYIDELIIHDFNYNMLENIKTLEKYEKANTYMGNAAEYCYTRFPGSVLEAEHVKESDDLVDQIIKQYPDHNMIIGVHTTGSEFSKYHLSEVRRVGDKSWDQDKWSQLLSVLEERYPKGVFIIFGGSNDLDANIGIKFPDRTISAVNRLSFGGAIEFIRLNIDLCVAVDSSVKSIAIYQCVPTIVLVNDHEDPIRDKTFLLPYRFDKHVDIIWKANETTVDSVMEKIDDLIKISQE